MVRSCRYAAAATGLFILLSLASAAGASAKTLSCGKYVGGAAGLTDTFTHIEASGVACQRAHEVLGTWANSGPGGTDLGFICAATPTAKKQFAVKCHEGTKRIKAVDTQKT